MSILWPKRQDGSHDGRPHAGLEKIDADPSFDVFSFGASFCLM